jgi:hypothetical protein
MQYDKRGANGCYFRIKEIKTNGSGNYSLQVKRIIAKAGATMFSIHWAVLIWTDS